METENYTIAGLASAVGVPRTTINDWLNRYAGFVESETIGKRRIFSARTVNVLKTVAELRDAGRTGLEVEEALAARFGVRPEVAAMPEDRSESSASEPELAENGAEDAPAAAPALDVPQLPALRELERNTMELSGVIAELRAGTLRSARRNRWLWAFMLVLVLVLLGCLLTLYQLLAAEHKARLQDMTMARQEKQELNFTLHNMQNEFARQFAESTAAAQAEREAASAQNRKYQQELEKLRAERNADLKKFEQQLAVERAQSQKLLEQQKAVAAKQNAEMQKAFLARLEEQSKASEARLAEEIQNARAEVQKLDETLAALRSQVSAKPEITGPVRPEPDGVQQ